MRFPSPLVRGKLKRRYNRFLADVVLDTGEPVVAACPNTGSMLGLCVPGQSVWLSRSDSLTRKYPYTWELVEADTGNGHTLTGINTNHPNKIVAEAIAAGRIAVLKGYAAMRQEVKYGKASRIDILLEDPVKGRAYVEVKNVHMMRRNRLAEFPDSVTERGVKHLQELSDMVAEGHRGVMLYLIQRGDASMFALADDIDPVYAAAFERASAAGVEMLAYNCQVNIQEVILDKKIRIRP